jgi:NAD(P)-dependent dehydrogenase (short-subunit alcohol dehydrogenase family)
VREGIASAARARGPVTICVANAGIAEAAPFHRETLEHWRRIMATNLDGAFLTFQAAMATLAPDQPARMIAIASIAGLRGLRNAIAYTASKHGVIGMVRGLSEEYMGGPVTFNAICPGTWTRRSWTATRPRSPSEGDQRRRGAVLPGAREPAQAAPGNRGGHGDGALALLGCGAERERAGDPDRGGTGGVMATRACRCVICGTDPLRSGSAYFRKDEGGRVRERRRA